MSKVKIDFKFPDWSEMVKLKTTDIMLSVAATLQTNRAMLFDQSGNYNGHRRWKDPLFRKGKPLLNRGNLRKSIGPSNDGRKPGKATGSIVQINGNVVTIGTSLPHARILNDGGKIVAKKAKALMIPVPGGKNATPAAKSVKPKKIGIKQIDGKVRKQGVIFRKSVVIPARNFDSLTSQDLKEVENTIKGKVMEIIGG